MSPRSSSKIPAIVFAIVVVAGLVGAGVWLFANRSDSVREVDFGSAQVDSAAGESNAAADSSSESDSPDAASSSDAAGANDGNSGGSAATRESEQTRQNVIGMIILTLPMMISDLSVSDTDCIASKMLDHVSADDIAAWENSEADNAMMFPPAVQDALAQGLQACLTNDQLAEYNQFQMELGQMAGGS